MRINPQRDLWIDSIGKFQDSLEKNKSHQIWKLLEGVG